MTDALEHRGPDASGYWEERAPGLGFGHRRLSIVDLSPTGAQPMTSASGRYTICFNGEVYNFQSLREELEARGCVFRGQSDTEVMLAAIEQFGILAAVKRFVGMFAFALWDSSERCLTLARDRLGKKPLYYAVRGRRLAFGSELKALFAMPGFSAEIDRASLAAYMRFQYVPAPRSILAGVAKLEQGAILQARQSGASDELSISIAKYWSARDAFAAPAFGGSEADPRLLEDRLESLLSDAVRIRMIADVPLGAFLSGGIDSSLVVALMQRQSAARVRSFSIGFREAEYDESKHAAAVARHLGVDHTELFVTAADALAVVPNLPQIYDEPFGDSSQIPTYLVSKLARAHVTVALSGDGGDELFCGYNRYLWWRSIWPRVRLLPGWLRRSAANLLLSRTASEWDMIIGSGSRMLPASLRRKAPGHLMRKAAETLAIDSPAELYLRLVSHWKDPATVVLGANEPPSPILERWPEDSAGATIRMMLLDVLTYLPDDILVKVDRATMAASLESRSPLLDHRVLEFAARVPLSQKVLDSKGKLILRRLLFRHVPQELVDRPKTGFGIPLAEWLRGPLRAWADSLLDRRQLEEQGFLDAPLLRARWDDFVRGTNDDHYAIWTALMFQAWLQQWRSVTRASAS
jgi:asparagine synthase (glutamine-hydrolysing)